MQTPCNDQFNLSIQTILILVQLYIYFLCLDFDFRYLKDQFLRNNMPTQVAWLQSYWVEVLGLDYFLLPVEGRNQL